MERSLGCWRGIIDKNRRNPAQQRDEMFRGPERGPKCSRLVLGRQPAKQKFFKIKSQKNEKNSKYQKNSYFLGFGGKAPIYEKFQNKKKIYSIWVCGADFVDQFSQRILKISLLGVGWEQSPRFLRKMLENCEKSAGKFASIPLPPLRH